MCTGEVPNQNDIMDKIADVILSSGIGIKEEEELTPTEWTREAIGYGAIVELSKPVYLGRPDLKMQNLASFWRAAAVARKPALMEKALDGMKELAEETGLEAFKGILQEISQRNV